MVASVDGKMMDTPFGILEGIIMDNSFGTLVVTMVLVFVTAYYAWLVRDQSKTMKNQLDIMKNNMDHENIVKKYERLVTEMERVVGPLYAKRLHPHIFMKGEPYQVSKEPKDIEYYKFWDMIMQNKHLTSYDLYQSINEFLDFRLKSTRANETGNDDPLFLESKKKLIEKIEIRYSKLEKELEDAKNKI